MTTQNHETALRARRAEILSDLNVIEGALDAPAPADWEDRSSERQGDDVLEARGNRELDDLRRIDAALARIAEGTYGICVKCGCEISQARLALLPSTPLCRHCAV